MGTLVLTTHSMNEAESLCTKIGILINGRFQCIGSPQELKSRFGTGFNIQILMYEKDRENQAVIERIKSYVKEKFPDSQDIGG